MKPIGKSITQRLQELKEQQAAAASGSGGTSGDTAPIGEYGHLPISLENESDEERREREEEIRLLEEEYRRCVSVAAQIAIANQIKRLKNKDTIHQLRRRQDLER